MEMKELCTDFSLNICVGMFRELHEFLLKKPCRKVGIVHGHFIKKKCRNVRELHGFVIKNPCRKGYCTRIICLNNSVESLERATRIYNKNPYRKVFLGFWLHKRPSPSSTVLIS